MVDSRDTHGPDLAALLGAAIVVLLTLTFGQGAWGPISTIVGLLLLFMLFGYFWGQRQKDDSRAVDWAALVGAAIVVGLTLSISPGALVRVLVGLFVGLLVLLTWWVYGLAQSGEFKSILVGAAFSVVVGLVGSIAAAQAVQARWFGDDANDPTCRSVAVAQATTAVGDLRGVGASPGTLSRLVGHVLMTGAPEPPVEKVGDTNAAMRNAFYDEYRTAIGDCLAGNTFEQLWWIGVPFFLLTFAWWNLSRKKTSAKDKILSTIRGLRRSRREPSGSVS